MDTGSPISLISLEGSRISSVARLAKFGRVDARYGNGPLGEDPGGA